MSLEACFENLELLHHLWWRSFCFVLVIEMCAVSFLLLQPCQPPAATCCHAVSTAMNSSPLEPYANSFFFKLHWSCCVLSQRQKSNQYKFLRILNNLCAEEMCM